ncbi:unnamed protein product [Litomosoides sigmodontis]|uniref:Membrane magnesium transporter n=1 Tax=Litomosoides sigmodontis TaxID=42156 RepID=A0A3P6TJX1_LITSI|nr:unnamed protein product [Litomosoides sigmodontis]
MYFPSCTLLISQDFPLKAVATYFHKIQEFYAILAIRISGRLRGSIKGKTVVTSMNPASLSVFRGVCLAGLVSLLHCAYSAAQHRFYLRLTEQPFTQLPLDIALQTVVSLIAFVYSATYIAGEFQPIRSDLQNRTKSWDTVGNCPSFYTFDHRARTLSPSLSDSPQHYCDSSLYPSSSTVKDGKLFHCND